MKMANKFFNVTQDRGVATITFSNSKKANAFNAEFWREFPLLLKDLDEKGDVRVCILAGEGKHFSSGIDVGFLTQSAYAEADSARARDTRIRLIGDWQAVLDLIERVRFPVIAAVHGACLGAALDLAAACDFRYAAKDAFFSIEEINLGLMADLGSLQRLPLTMPEAVVRDLAYTGRRFTADEALSYGLVSDVYDNEDLIAQTVKTAHLIASKSPIAIAACKRAFSYRRNHGLASALEHTQLLQAALIDSQGIAQQLIAKATGEVSKFEDLLPNLNPAIST